MEIGIGPLSPEEYDYVTRDQTADEMETNLPIGIDSNKLAFRTAFADIQSIGNKANKSALELKDYSPF